MKLSKSHLFNHLKESDLNRIYCFCADESIQITALSDKVIATAKSKGFEEKQTFVISKDTDWSFLNANNENLDLFGSSKILEIKLIGTGPGSKGSKAIKEYCLNADPNKLLIFSVEKLDKKQLNSAWIKALEENGILVIEPPITCLLYTSPSPRDRG